MATLEYWARIVRLVFVVALAIAGYIGLISLTEPTAEGTALTFLKFMFWPFIIATVFVEIIQICKALSRPKQSS